MIVGMKWFWAVLAICVAGCSSEGSGTNTAKDGEAKAVKYGELHKHVGERVKTVAWVFGEGESYRVEGQFVLALVPEPEMDWVGFFTDYDEMSSLVESLAGEPERRAEGRDVDKYTKLQAAANKWSGEIAKLEKAPESTAWGHFKQNVLAARYDWFGDAPSILVSPKRSELKAAADKLFERYEQIAKSCELEIVGKVWKRDEWAKNNRLETTLGAQLSQKDLVIEVESYKVLRTARDAAKAAGRGTAGLEEAKTDPSPR